MKSSGLDRREFHQLTLAALSGVIAGTTTGCNNGGGGMATPPKTTAGDKTAAAGSAKPPQITLSDAAEALIMDEPHTCRGLNSCKGLGRDKENSCAGQGTCASIADAVCGGHNDCKGQGGCGSNPGMNDCKGQGGCHIPLMDDAWKTARAAFEVAMNKNGKSFSAAPREKVARVRFWTIPAPMGDFECGSHFRVASKHGLDAVEFGPRDDTHKVGALFKTTLSAECAVWKAIFELRLAHQSQSW